MDQRIEKIVIVGGGTAGWITAGRLAKKHGPKSNRPVAITLIESPTIKTIGVGEGTWPSLRETLKDIGILETDFVRECDAVFKQGGKFVSWVHDDPSEHYYHPFNLPSGHQHFNITPYGKGVIDAEPEKKFADIVDFQARLCDAGLAPKKITTPEYQAVANYAYHLDTNKLGEFLKRHCIEVLGVEHILDDVEDVHTDETGYITHLSVQRGDDLAGDLFVDCTGARALLLGQTMGAKFQSCQDVLFVDRALACHVPYENENDPITCHTIATAQKVGWVWDIGLQHRRGIGHVYSSSHTSNEAAEQTFETYLRTNTHAHVEDLSIRQLKIENGYRDTFWVKNCVGVGLSAGFLEPLEASAIMLLESAAKLIANRMPPTREAMRLVAKQFNEIMTDRWERIVDFLKLHYAITKRTDSAFWIENTRPETIPDHLSEMLELWRHMPPSELDFETTSTVFPAASYQYVLLGMEFECDYSSAIGDAQEKQQARKLLATSDRLFDRLKHELPDHRALLQSIRSQGMQVV